MQEGAFRYYSLTSLSGRCHTRIQSIGIGIALAFTYILFLRFSQMFVHTGTLPPAIALWLPNLVFAIIAGSLYRVAPK